MLSPYGDEFSEALRQHHTINKQLRQIAAQRQQARTTFGVGGTNLPRIIIKNDLGVNKVVRLDPYGGTLFRSSHMSLVNNDALNRFQQ